MDALALTDRDGVRGAVKFVLACQAAGIAPVLGADLALAPEHPALGALRSADPRAKQGRPGRTRTPARGGSSVDPRLPRVTVLARDRAGWAALCRLLSLAHATERGHPVATFDAVVEQAADAGLVVMLGPDSSLGRILARGRPDLAAGLLRRWRDALPARSLAVEVVDHRGADPAGRSAAFAARTLGFANDHQVPAVLTNAVRYARREDAPVADVLDATRRLVPLDPRHIDRRTGEGYLKSGRQMEQVAAEVVRLSGSGTERSGVRRLLDTTRALADACRLDPHDDLGIGSVHFPELAVVDPAAVAAGRSADAVLRDRCEAGLVRRGIPGSGATARAAGDRLAEELSVIAGLGYATYFLTVADVCDLIRSMDVRVAARGSGAGSLVTYLLGISGVDPMRHDLLFERFLSPLRQALPDIDVDVESARRTEIYRRIFDRFGDERVACVSMADTYRVRHAVRDVGAALGLPPGEVDTVAKAFPHIRARDARSALRELPELRASGIGREPRFDLLFRLVEKLDGLPRHLALHPCGVLLSDASLLDRTPVEASALGFAMSQFDKDDVEHLGLLKLDVLGIRMQSSMAYALDEIERVDGGAARPVLDAVPLDDSATFDLIRSTHTLGCFQIESPGQRELVGKFAPETFGDLVIDISLFRPGPVKSDMVRPFLAARHGWAQPQYLHPDLEPVLRETYGVVVFHEQVIRMISVVSGCSLAEGDEKRRALGDPDGQAETREWFYPRALRRGYPLPVVEQVWEVLRAFASFGFCKAHAAAFALPTYQSAWLKAHHPAAFLAGVLTHDPGMYPKRLILDDARQFGIAVLPLDVNASDATYRVERVAPSDEPPPRVLAQLHGEGAPRGVPDHPGLPDARGYGIRLSLADVKGINDAEVDRIVAGQPYRSLADFWHRAAVSRPVAERLVLAGGLDSLYGIGSSRGGVTGLRRRGQVTRRDLLLQVAELGRWHAMPAVVTRQGRTPDVQLALALDADPAAGLAGDPAEALAGEHSASHGVDHRPSGLPEMTDAERVRAELDVLGLDVSRHVVDFYVPLLEALGVVRARQLLGRRSRSEVLVAGVKVATQTPPIRSGRRVVFVTLDDATGPIDATFFEDAQGPYAATLFHSWLLVVRGEVRRTGPRGVSLRATGCWELSGLYEVWQAGGLPAVHALLDTEPVGFGDLGEESVAGAADSRSSRPVMVDPGAGSASRAGGMGRRRVLVHPSGFRQSPYADVRPPGEDAKRGTPPRKLWHASPGSAGG
ncbi:MAG: DNA polymerase III subunit alpha, partial [Actinomycetota bacterium]|nr:DNA polymerase III subunit alpha [Actinomycetota bacterium]